MSAARNAVLLDAKAVKSAAPQLDESFLKAVQLIRHCKGKVLTTGMGTSGATARRLAHLLSCGGTPALFIHSADALHGTLGAVASGDVVIPISKGGESDEINEFVRRARVRGARVVAMSSVPDSPLAKLSDITICVSFAKETDPGSIMAMGSAIGFAAVGDALVVALMTLRGFEEKLRDLGFLHPGGAVGKQVARQE